MTPREPPQPQDLISMEAMAKRFGTSARTLERQIQLGKFPRPRDFGGQPMYTEEEYAAYIVLAGRWYPHPSVLREDLRPRKKRRRGRKKGDSGEIPGAQNSDKR